MAIEHLYKKDFPDKHRVKETDVVKLYHEGRFDELDAVVICKDIRGKVTATFGNESWNCLPYSRKKNKNTLPFSELNNHPELQRELKLFTYGWLFNKSPKRRKARSFSAVNSRRGDLIKVYLFLAENGHTSIQSLSRPLIWESFKTYLANLEYAQSSIESALVSINTVIDFKAWHMVNHGFNKKIESKKIAKELGCAERQQTLTIPERLCDAIYGKAIELVEEAHPYRDLIAQTESNLQENYLKGKEILDTEIKNGSTFKFMLDTGYIDNRKYTVAIADYLPKEPSDIVAILGKKLTNVSLKNGYEFRRYFGQLVTASYIVCGGFSGMRDSELDKLTPNSYYKDTFEGRDYHMLQSHTFKLGEKRETWVTASSSKIAIELMSALTQKLRQEVNYPDKKYTNSLWVNQSARSRSPTLISNWNNRLQRFCRQFNFIVTADDYQECIDSNPRSQYKVQKSKSPKVQKSKSPKVQKSKSP